MTSGYKERELLRRDLRTWADYFANHTPKRIGFKGAVKHASQHQPLDLRPLRRPVCS